MPVVGWLGLGGLVWQELARVVAREGLYGEKSQGREYLQADAGARSAGGACSAARLSSPVRIRPFLP